MKAFLLAAGFGERLRPITDAMPKPLVPVMNVPTLCYALSLIKKAGITDIVSNIHYHREQIIEFFRRNNDFGLNITFSIEETILGTGGGLENCREHFKDGPFIYINSDIIAPVDLKSFISSCDTSRMDGTLLVSRGTGQDSRVTVGNGRVINLRKILTVEERPGHDFLGIAMLTPEIFRYLKHGFSDIVENGFIDLVKRGSLGCHEYVGPWHDVGSIESYRRANMALLEMDNDFRTTVTNATAMEPVAVAATARIGGDCSIRRSVIGGKCVIGDGAVIEESVILPGVSVRAGEKIFGKVVF